MVFWLRIILVAVIGYLLGNISVGILVSKLYGVVDIRKYGSGGSGSTNVLRTLGWAPSLMTLVGDCLKAFLAAKLGSMIAGDAGLLVGGAAAIVGHDFPVFLGFRGGKGIACSLGFILAMNGWIALILTVVVVGIAGVTRYVSVGSIVGSILFPILTAIFMRGHACYAGYIIASIIVCLLNLFCHRKNIVRLSQHAENRLDFAKISKLSKKLHERKK